MNRRIRFTILVAVLALTTMACELSGILVENNIGTIERGSGSVVAETRPVSGITGVDLATIGTVIIQVGDNESLRIEAEDNLMEYFETDVRGGILRIETTPATINLRPTEPVHFFLTVKDLERVRASYDLVTKTSDTRTFVVINQTRPQGDRADQSINFLTSMGFTICPHSFGHRVAYEDADTTGQTPQETEPRGKAASEILSVYQYTIAALHNITSEGVNHAERLSRSTA